MKRVLFVCVENSNRSPMAARVREDRALPDPRELDANGVRELRDPLERRVKELLARL